MSGRGAGTVGVLAACLGFVLFPAAAQALPSLSSISYISCPYERTGATSLPVATVQLDGPAPSDTSISVTSDNPSVATVPSTVTVSTGASSTTIPVTTFSAGSTTLSATLGPDTLNLLPSLTVDSPSRVPALSDLALSPTSVSPGQSSTGTVTLDWLAGPSGTTVALASDNSQVQVPIQVVVSADQCRATFMTSTLSTATGSADITATLDAVTKHAQLTLVPDGGGGTPLPPTGTATGSSAPTGQRAAALKKCKKKSAKARKKCKKKAKLLPV